MTTLRKAAEVGMKPDQLTQDLAMIARNAIDYIIQLERERDALLKALKEIHQATMRNGIVLAKCVGISAIAGMAIAKAEGDKNGQT